MQCVATCCSVFTICLQCVAVCLQCDAVCCRVICDTDVSSRTWLASDLFKVECSVLQYVAVWLQYDCRVFTVCLQCVSVCCSVLQCVCSMLQCVAVSFATPR